jgi:hypothetical protein
VRTSLCAAEQAPPVAKPVSMTSRRTPSRSRWLPVVASLAPAFAFLAAFTYWPVLRVLGESFMVGRFAGQHALGLDNDRRLLADPHFARAAWNNAAYAVGTIVPSLVLASAVRAGAAGYQPLHDGFVAGEWSRFTGYFAPRKAAYDVPEMKDYLQQHPDAKVALDQLRYAVPWFDTYNTVAVRKAMEDQVQAILSGKTSPAEAVQTAQKNADELLRPYVEQTALKQPA